MVKISGASAHTARLARMVGAETRRAVNRALYAAGQEIEIEAETSITAGSISGKGHVPSRPGEPPNADTRQLDTNIQTVFARDLLIEVEATAPHAAPLEFGTSKMAARPFMKPAARKKRAAAQQLVAKAVAKANRR